MSEAIARGDIWWAELHEPTGSAPGYPRPVLVVQSDVFNKSRIHTTVVVPFSSARRLAAAPGNVLVPRDVGGLFQDSVANVSQIFTADRGQLVRRMGTLPPEFLRRVESGLVRVLGLV